MMPTTRTNGNALLLIVVMVRGLAACTTGAQETPLSAHHIERTASFQLDGAPEDVFSLLGPRGRQRWVKNWDMEFLYPPSGDARPGAVVRQVLRNGSVEQIWLLVESDPPARLEYVIFVPGMEAWEFDTRLRPAPGGKTSVTVEHRLTSLAQAANAEVQRFADDFDAYVERFRSAINAALREAGHDTK